MEKDYELPISPNYVCNWGVNEAIREILQNAIDADSSGFRKEITYDSSTGVLRIKNSGTQLLLSSLVLGCSSKSNMEDMIGKYGEGYKLALVVLLRDGHDVIILNKNELWIPSFKNSKTYNTQILNIHVESSNETSDGIEYLIGNITQDLYNSLLLNFPCINDDYGKTVGCDNGTILLDKKFKGRMYVEGLYIQSDNNFDYGYNFNSDVVDLDRDRKAINYYELRKLTAASIISAESCEPEIFRAISNSCVDTRAIIDVLDDASEEFLEQYRDMIYKEKGLEENTLIATESVMRQLEQMDIDTPVVKGTEIESFLVAKANDKLGLIFDAQEEIQRRDEEEDSWYFVEHSDWFRLKCWLKQYGMRISKRGKEEFEIILERIKPSSYSSIKKYFNEDFEWTEENFDNLKEQIKNQT